MSGWYIAGEPGPEMVGFTGRERLTPKQELLDLFNTWLANHKKDNENEASP